MTEYRKSSVEDWRRFKAGLIEEDLERRRALYMKSLNPVHALRAYRTARTSKIVDIPNWVLEMFDQWAEVLCVQQPKGAKAIANALRLGTNGGPAVTSQAKTQARDLQIASRVSVLRKIRPESSKMELFDQVAEEFGISSERVAGIWYELTNSKAP
jgi:hypothetical protein